MTVSLGKLVRTSLARKTNKKIFGTLLAQLIQSEDPSDNEIKESFLTYNGLNNPLLTDPQARLQLEYVLEWAFSGADSFALFVRILALLPEHTQRRYIVAMKSRLTQPVPASLAKPLAEALCSYTVELSQNCASSLPASPELQSLFRAVIFLWGLVLTSIGDAEIQAHLNTMIPPVFKALGTLGDPNAQRYFEQKVASSGNSMKHIHPESLATRHGRNYLLQTSSKKFVPYVRAKKFTWLNSNFKQWTLHSLAKRYMAFFKVPLHHVETVHELVGIFLSGHAAAVALGEDRYVIFNWQNYILVELPRFLAELFSSDTLETIGDTVVAAVSSHTYTVLECDGTLLAKLFLRSCLYHKVISVSQFTAQYPQDTESISTSLITHEMDQLKATDALATDIRSKLENVNTEFTSLEESGLVEFLQALPKTNLRFSLPKQLRLNQVISDLTDRLILQRDSERLGRLALALANSVPTANFIFFNDPKGPWSLTKKLIAYVDEESFTVDHDDSNFQDTYACFGVILGGVIAIVDNFGVDLSSVNIVGSYTIDYINSFYYRLCDDLITEYTAKTDEESTVLQNFNEHFENWTNALFDVNNEGLSDDLIKSISVKQIYKLVFVLFRHAIQARIMDTMSDSSLDNGIDYLSQNFLAPSSPSILMWLIRHLGPLQPHNEIVLRVILKILKGNGEGGYTLKMNLLIVAPELSKRLSALPASGDVTELKSMLAASGAQPPQKALATTFRRVTLGETLRDEIGRLLRDGQKDALQLGEWWHNIRTCWQVIPSAELFASLMLAIERSESADFVSEECKLYLDFTIFMLLATSPLTRDAASRCLERLTTSKTVETEVGENSKFLSSIDDHFSLVFNDVVASKPEPKVKDELMEDFEIDDLFKVVSGNLFEDVPASQTDLEQPYRNLVLLSSPLMRIIWDVKNCTSAGASVIHGRLEAELLAWKQALDS